MLLKGTQPSPKMPALLFAGIAVLLGIVAGILIISVNNPLFILVGLASLIGFVATVASVEFGLLLLVFITYTRFSDIAVHIYNAPSIAKSLLCYYSSLFSSAGQSRMTVHAVCFSRLCWWLPMDWSGLRPYSMLPIRTQCSILLVIT